MEKNSEFHQRISETNNTEFHQWAMEKYRSQIPTNAVMEQHEHHYGAENHYFEVPKYHLQQQQKKETVNKYFRESEISKELRHKAK